MDMLKHDKILKINIKQIKSHSVIYLFYKIKIIKVILHAIIFIDSYVYFVKSWIFSKPSSEFLSIVGTNPYQKYFSLL